MAREVRWAANALSWDIDVVIDSSPILPVGAHCAARRRVYWVQDDYAGGADLLGVPAKSQAAGEARLLREADVVIAANPKVRQQILTQGREAALIPFGADTDHFERTGQITSAPGVYLPAPVAGFMGQLGDRIDFRILNAVAEREVSLLLIGPLHPRADPRILEDLLQRPNVQWVGGQDFESLPAWLSHVHTGIIPYNHSPFNEGSFPLKTLEYLAAGIPVVATDLPAIRWLDSPDIRIADAPKQFADAVEDSLRDPRSPRSDARRQTFARQHSWRKRAEAFTAEIGTRDIRP